MKEKVTHLNRGDGWIDVKKSSEEANRSPPKRKLPEPKGNIPIDDKTRLKSLLNQSGGRIITGGNKLRTDVLRLIESCPKGIPYPHVVEAFIQNESEVYDIIHLLMQEGKCYEPKLGLLVPINPSLRSSSAEQLENQSAERISQLKKEPGTPDILQSSEATHTPIASVDTAEGTLLNQPILTYPPSAVPPIHNEIVKSLEDAIADRVYDKPEMDTVIMREFMSRGFQMPEIHWVLKDSIKLHRYKQGENLMIVYKGVRGDKEMDVGV